MRALAKLTLSLRVTGVRPDGYHLLDAEMVSVDLADTLYFSAGDGLDSKLPVKVVVKCLGTGPTWSCVLWRWWAAGAHVRLVKRIPAGAGLGGGSADAAAVLRWAGRPGLPGLEAAMKLGSDVPFCLAGGGRQGGGHWRGPGAAGLRARGRRPLYAARPAVRGGHGGRVPGLGRYGRPGFG